MGEVDFQQNMVKYSDPRILFNNKLLLNSLKMKDNDLNFLMSESLHYVHLLAASHHSRQLWVNPDPASFYWHKEQSNSK